MYSMYIQYKKQNKNYFRICTTCQHLKYKLVKTMYITPVCVFRQWAGDFLYIFYIICTGAHSYLPQWLTIIILVIIKSSNS